MRAAIITLGLLATVALMIGGVNFCTIKSWKRPDDPRWFYGWMIACIFWWFGAPFIGLTAIGAALAFAP